MFINNFLGDGSAAFFAIEIDGVLYNADKSINIFDIDQPWQDVISITLRSASISISTGSKIPLQVRLIPSVEQLGNSVTFEVGNGYFDTANDGSIYFRLRDAS